MIVGLCDEIVISNGGLNSISLLAHKISLNLSFLVEPGVLGDPHLDVLIFLPGLSSLDEVFDALEEHIVVRVVVGDSLEEVLEGAYLLGTLNLVLVDSRVINPGEPHLEVSSMIGGLENVLLEVVPVVLDV